MKKNTFLTCIKDGDVRPIFSGWAARPADRDLSRGGIFAVRSRVLPPSPLQSIRRILFRAPTLCVPLAWNPTAMHSIHNLHMSPVLEKSTRPSSRTIQAPPPQNSQMTRKKPLLSHRGPCADSRAAGLLMATDSSFSRLIAAHG